MNSETSATSQIEVYFKPLSAEVPFHCPSEAFLVPSNLRRKGLSELLNHLMSIDPPQPFDFLINGQFLRLSLQEYLDEKGLTSEISLTLLYTLVATKPDTIVIGPKQDDWIAAVNAPFQTGVAVTGCYDGRCNIYVLNQQTNQYHEPRSFPMGDVGVSCVSCFHDRKQSDSSLIGVICGMKDNALNFGTVLISSNREDCTMLDNAVARGHEGAVQCVAVNSDGSTVLSGSWDNTVLLWDNSTMLEAMWDIQHDRPHNNQHPKLSTDYNSNNHINGKKPKREETATNKKKRRASDSAKQPKLRLQGHTASVTDVCFSSVYQPSFYSASLDSTLRCWDMLSGGSICVWTAGKPILSVSESPNGHYLCTSHEDGHVKVWDIRSGSDAPAYSPKALTPYSQLQFKQAYHSHKRLCPRARWNPASDLLIASVSYDGALKIYDIRSFQIPLHTVEVSSDDGIIDKLLDCSWSTAESLLTGGSNGILRSHTIQ